MSELHEIAIVALGLIVTAVFAVRIYL